MIKSFHDWVSEESATMLEMASLFPQRKEDKNERVATTHMGFPVYAPTVYHLLVSRDSSKYPDGLTVSEIADELIRKSEPRKDIKGNEVDLPEDWEKQIRKPETWTKFLKGLNSMLSKSPDFVSVGKRRSIGDDGSEGGRLQTVFLPTEDAQKRQGGAKFLSQTDREKFKQDQVDRQGQQAEKEKDQKDKEQELSDLFQ